MSFEPQVQWVNAEEAGSADKTRWSNFWIMINSNQAGENIVERSHLVTVMRKAINSTLGNKKNLISLLRVIENGAEVIDAQKRREEINKIESVVSEAVVEVGPQVHRVHAHVLLMIQHKSKIQIDVGAMRDLIREASMEDGRALFPNPIVRFKYIRENPINAIRKYQRGYKGRIPGSLIAKVSRKMQ